MITKWFLLVRSVPLPAVQEVGEVYMEISLFCLTGMSIAMLVQKMEAAAKKSGLEAIITAYPETNDKERALLGPQVRFKLTKAKGFCETK